MKKHSNTYEQYCWVLHRNIVFEETIYHNGTSSLSCTHYYECKDNGGCKNEILARLLSQKKEGKH